MANPQKEDGYTPIANEILEAFGLTRISGEENQVFWVIVRKTYGYQKTSDEISLSQFCLATGMNKQNVCRALSNLIKKKMIIKIDKGWISNYRIQKDYTTWLPLSKLITLSKLIKTVIKTDKESVINIETHKRNKNTKETTTKEKSIVPSMQKPSSGPSKITYDFENFKWKNIQQFQKDRWKIAYPACDIELELLGAAEWLIANPTKRKSNYQRFITNWLSRSQERGGTKGSNQIAAPGSWSKSRAKEREEKNVK